MNRPEKKNALSGDDAGDHERGLGPGQLGRRRSGSCILTGAGGAFCAGADLSAMSATPPAEKFESEGEFDPAVIKSLLKGFRLTKPLIAAVEGPAIAGGTEILQATDIRVAGESARFGVSEVRWGLYPLGGSAVRLPRQIPYTVAADLLLTGRHISAEAMELRPHRPRRPRRHGAGEGARARRPHLRQRPARRPGRARHIRGSEGKHEDECWADDARIGAAVFASADAKEGPRAFVEDGPRSSRGSDAQAACSNSASRCSMGLRPPSPAVRLKGTINGAVDT